MTSISTQPANPNLLPNLPKINKHKGSDPRKSLSQVFSDCKEEEDNKRLYYLEVVDNKVLDSLEKKSTIEKPEINQIGQIQIPDDDEDYEEIPIEEFDDGVISDEEDESLENATRTVQENIFLAGIPEPSPPQKSEVEMSITKRPEVIDDYIRNFLASKNLTETLNTFQNEWYEHQQRGKLSAEDVTIVPDIYRRNQELGEALQKLRVDVENYKEIASKARSTYDKLRKERDFHRMHHKRVVQEKNKLIGDIKRLKSHYQNYEPTLKQLQSKYESAMKEKMLTKLERDRLISKNQSLEAALKQMEKSLKDLMHGNHKPNFEKNPKPQENFSLAQKKSSSKKSHRPTSGPTSKDNHTKAESTLPIENRKNPYLNVDLPSAKVEKFKQIHVFRAHELAVSSVKFHPKKLILATVSDDKTWKLWSFPSSEIIMSGEGHKDWIADCDFHPSGNMLATASGDSTVKIWDFSKGVATLTLSDHTQAVWSCGFHETGDFLVSGSMDHTAKLWDINTGKCRQTFRGHADSINSVGFEPYTNTIYSCSGDKTISLWDARTGLCSQTLYGHLNAINHMTFSLRGDTVVSCDAGGIVKFWDLRNVTELSSIGFGPYPANKVSLDASGSSLAVASNDGQCKLYNVKSKYAYNSLGVHEDSVQAVVFDKSSEFLVTSGSDCTVRIFQ